MNKLSVRAKLLICFGMIDAMFLIVFGAGYFSMRAMKNTDKADKVMNNFLGFTAIMIIVIAIIMTIFTVIIVRTIRQSTDKLRVMADEIAKGKTNIDIEKTSEDEFGKVIDEYAVVVENIKEQVKIVEEVADGNLTLDVSPKSDEDNMGAALHKLVTNTHHAISNIHDAAYQVMSSSTEVASASEALAQGSTQQASAIQQITASIADIAEKTKNNATQASDAASLMTEALVDVNKGNQQMHYMVGAMEEINNSSKGISKIIKVIDDIAFQTNILALNAAVEAARAGDAGMGFAVVAEEVRNLAAKSAAAAAETAEMIEDSILKVQNGSEVAGQTAKALELISEIVSKSEIIIKGIADSSKYQATAIEQIDQAVEQVSQVVQSNSSTSEECAAASMELSNQANRMKELVSVYKLGGSSDVLNATSTAYTNDTFVSTPVTTPRFTTPSIDKNEAIISLRDGFGKY